MVLFFQNEIDKNDKKATPEATKNIFSGYHSYMYPKLIAPTRPPKPKVIPE